MGSMERSEQSAGKTTRSASTRLKKRQSVNSGGSSRSAKAQHPERSSNVSTHSGDLSRCSSCPCTRIQDHQATTLRGGSITDRSSKSVHASSAAAKHRGEPEKHSIAHSASV